MAPPTALEVLRDEIVGTSSTRPPGEAILVGSYHVSQQNTQTGRLTPAMFDGALAKAARLAGLL